MVNFRLRTEVLITLNTVSNTHLNVMLQ